MSEEIEIAPGAYNLGNFECKIHCNTLSHSYGLKLPMDKRPQKRRAADGSTTSDK